MHLSNFLYTVYQFLPNLVSNDVSAGNKLKSTDDDEELAALELTPKISYTSS